MTQCLKDMNSDLNKDYRFNPSLIRNLLFDMGGVVIDLSINRSKEAFRELGLENPDELLDAYVQKGAFARLESGTIAPKEFFDEIRCVLPPKWREAATDKVIEEAFSKFLLGLPADRLRALHRLSGRYNVCLLSNTNAIMWHGKIASLFREDGHDLDYYFPGGVVASFEAKCMKPDKEIFVYAEKHLDIKPGETLFLDDGPANIIAARKLGFKALLVKPGTEFMALLKAYGI